MNASLEQRATADTVDCSTITSGSSTLATPPSSLPSSEPMAAIFDSSSFWNCAADASKSNRR